MAGRPGRREQPLDPQAGPLERFALGLRALRTRAGLTYSEMADACHFSPSTLSQAAAGQRLPTREVLRAYVSACGGDPHPWEERRQRLERELYPTARALKPSVGDAGPGSYGHGDLETTSFVGRERELATIPGLLDRYRMVTLTGVGGVGKTRLAKRLVRQVLERFPDGVYCAELADLDNEHAVAVGVASAVGVQLGSGQDPLSTLAAALSGRRSLLLLDNCEHVLDSSAHTAHGLLARLPRLRILATSRQPLDIGAEYVLPVRPLGLPPMALPRSWLAEADETPTSPAMTLFADRADAASPGFRVTEQNRHAVARVCRKLDGLPLALEIAARRLRTLTLDELLERLDHRFRLLGPGGSDRTAPPRHQALRALFDWSYELCTEAERRTWEQLSLCSGGVLLSDAEHLCGPCDEHYVPLTGVTCTTGTTKDSAPDTFEALAGLVDKSVLTRVDTGTQSRLHMLETVRAYGQERLAQSSWAWQARRRHRTWYLDLAARAGMAYGSSEEARWLVRLRTEHANLRQIVVTPPPAEEPPETVLRASLGFWLHCLASANVGEGAGWMRKILERHPRPSSPETTTVWCQATWVACFLLLLHGDHTGAQEFLDRGEQALADTGGGNGVGGNEMSAPFLQMRSLIGLVTGDMDSAEKYAHAALTAGPGSDPLLSQRQCIAQLGFAALIQGDHDRSTPLLEQALAMSEARGDTWHRCYLLWALAVDHGEAGRPETALRLLRQALQHIRQIDEHMGEAALGETLAWILSSRGDARSAALVLGAVDGAWHPSGTPRLFGFAILAAHRQLCIRNAHRSLGEAEYARAHQDGRHLGLRAVLERVFGTEPP